MRCKCGREIEEIEFSIDPSTDMCGSCRNWLASDRIAWGDGLVLVDELEDEDE